MVKFVGYPLMLIVFTLFMGPSISHASSLPKNDFKTVFVQLFEWPWADVAEECVNYLGPNGFAAVQVSPPTEHMVWEKSPWWERYQPVSYKLQSRSGNEEEFKKMIQVCKDAGVDVYVDVVLNHMAGIEEGFSYTGSKFKHYEYQGLFDYNDFHHCGRNRDGTSDDNIVDFTDSYELLFCELVNLADLATEKTKVRNTLANYLNRLLSFGVAGFRIDAAKHIPPQDIRAILDQLNGDPFILQELIISPGEPVQQADYAKNGDWTVFHYAYDVGFAFQNRNMDHLTTISETADYPWSDEAVVFIDNHDLQRTQKNFSELVSMTRDPKVFQLAQTFLLTWPYGYPQIFSGYQFQTFDDGPPVDRNRRTLKVLKNGQCQAPWLCEHRLKGVKEMVQFRNFTNDRFYASKITKKGGFISFSRGEKGFVAINSNLHDVKYQVSTDLSKGTYIDLLSGAEYYVPASGQIQVRLKAQSAIVLSVLKKTE